MTEAPIPLARPWLGPEETEALREVVDSGILSRGDRLEAFEAGMAGLTGSAGGVGVNSGTVGLQIAMEALGIGPGDEVITPAFTFVGTVNAIARTGARPVLVDVDEHTLDIAPDAAGSLVSERTRALLIVHLFGRPAPMDELLALANAHDLLVIEDACEAIGARYRTKAVGGLGDAGVFGFYPNKPIATGEGGMIVGDDPDFLTRCRQLRNQGNDTLTATRHPERPGLSARLSELHAAVGSVQLERLEASLTRRRAIAERYREALADLAAIELPPEAAAHETIAWFTFPVVLAGADRPRRDALIEALEAAGIQSAHYFEPVHRLPYHHRRHDGRPLPVSERAGDRVLALPLFPGMSDAQVGRVCATLRRLVDDLG
jgi:perosamine synthetase